MQASRKKLLATIIILLTILVVALCVDIYIKAQSGSVTIDYTITDTTAVKVLFNGQAHPPQSTTSTSATYKLHKGSYDLSAALTGYKTFSTSFQLKSGNALVIDASLQAEVVPTLSSIRQISSLSNSGATVSNVQYFYDNTWAIATVTFLGYDTEIDVAKYDTAQQSWTSEVGPGTYFTQMSIQNLPTNIRAYLLNNNYVGSE